MPGHVTGSDFVEVYDGEEKVAFVRNSKKGNGIVIEIPNLGNARKKKRGDLVPAAIEFSRRSDTAPPTLRIKLK